MFLVQRALGGFDHDAHNRMVEVDLGDSDHLAKRGMMDDALRPGLAEGVGEEVDDVTIIDRFARRGRRRKLDNHRWKVSLVGYGKAFQELQGYVFLFRDWLCRCRQDAKLSACRRFITSSRLPCHRLHLS